MELKDQHYKKTASELFLSLQHVYKEWDYRCLVPDSHKNPAKWRTYDMHGFRAAYSKRTLNLVETFKHNKNFNNWIDPNVLKSFTKNPAKYWKKGHGFHYAKMLRWKGVGKHPTTSSVSCWKRCAHLEVSSFARHCKRKGGFVKCCVTTWNIGTFELSRNLLIEHGLLQDKQSHRCKTLQYNVVDPCRVCTAEILCTSKDPDDPSKLKQTTNTKYKKPHKVVHNVYYTYVVVSILY
jgi:hypothetical protein